MTFYNSTVTALPLHETDGYTGPVAIRGPLTYTIASNPTPVEGGKFRLILIASGLEAHRPVFTGATKATGSLDWDNRVGVTNIIDFTYSGGNTVYTIKQLIGQGEPQRPFVMYCYITSHEPNKIVLTHNDTLANVIPATSAFTVTASGGAATVSSIEQAGPLLRLVLNRAIAQGETVTAQYTRPGTNPITGFNLAKANSWKHTVVNNIDSTFAPVRLTSLSASCVESGTGPYTYTLNAGGSAWGASASSIPANANGEIRSIVPDNFIQDNNNISGMLLKLCTDNNLANSSLLEIRPGYGTYAQLFITSFNDAYQELPYIKPQPGDIMRVKRIGNTITCEYSRDGGTTWVALPRTTLPATSTAALYAKCQGSATNQTLKALIGKGFV
jgi:uncharacterized repeat protein (TIGR02059 family)